MSGKPYWIGIDAGEVSANLCVIDSEGAVHHECLCTTDPDEIGTVLASYDNNIETIGIESGAGTLLSRKLRERGYPVVVLEARQVRRFLSIRRNKTDASDAKGIADVTRLGRGVVTSVHIKSPEMQQLRSRLRIREKLVQQKVATEGLLRSMLALHGGRTVKPRSGPGRRRAVEAELARLETEESVCLSREILPLLELCEAQRAYLRVMDKTLAEAASDNQICSRFMEIPGIGPISALAFYSTIEQPDRFLQSRDVAAYLGLAPRIHQSGSLSKRQGITKMGDKLTRRLLVTAATCLLRKSTNDNALKAWGLGLSNRIGRPKARVAVARKLSIVMLAMWKRGEQFVLHPGPSGAPEPKPI